MNRFMRFIPLRHRSFQLMLLTLSFYIVHAHYSELDAIYATQAPIIRISIQIVSSMTINSFIYRLPSRYLIKQPNTVHVFQLSYHELTFTFFAEACIKCRDTFKHSACSGGGGEIGLSA